MKYNSATFNQSTLIFMILSVLVDEGSGLGFYSNPNQRCRPAACYHTREFKWLGSYYTHFVSATSFVLAVTGTHTPTTLLD